MKVAVLVSGGVDSSVALRLLKDQGHEVVAFYLKIWLEDELSFLGTCPWEDDLKYVRAVCEQAGVTLKIVSLQREYWDKVVAHTIREIKAGRTPNPDILCNQRIKFGAFLEYLGDTYDAIATGHYARVSKRDDGTAILRQSADPIKDQTYFLSYLSQDQLKRLIFPLGDYTKAQVRSLAHTYDLPNKDRKDSQGICFLGKIKFSDFIRHHLGEQTGDIVDIDTGTTVGKHRGYFYHTPGQRQGLGLAGGPWYVVRKDCDNNLVYVSRSYYAPDKNRTTFTVRDCSWLSGDRPTKNQLNIKIRHGAHIYSGILSYNHDGMIGVTLAQRDQGIAPGQYAAFYDGDVCLGSGIIE